MKNKCFIALEAIARTRHEAKKVRTPKTWVISLRTMHVASNRRDGEELKEMTVKVSMTKYFRELR